MASGRIWFSEASSRKGLLIRGRGGKGTRRDTETGQSGQKNKEELKGTRGGEREPGGEENQR